MIVAPAGTPLIDNELVAGVVLLLGMAMLMVPVLLETEDPFVADNNCVDPLQMEADDGVIVTAFGTAPTT